VRFGAAVLLRTERTAFVGPQNPLFGYGGDARMDAKPVDDLTPDDFARFPVWEFDTDGESLPGRDETWVVPVADLPVASLSGRVVGVALRLGGRDEVGLLGNIDLADPRSSQEFATLSVWRGGRWFHLARYFDPYRDRSGPRQLAELLGLAVADLFPIRYDLSGVAVGHPESVQGRFEAEPAVRLTRTERIALALGR
jgi:hypothetical protein